MPEYSAHPRTLESLQRKIIACQKCPRLVRHCRKVAAEKRRMYRDQDYWGRPVPSFGDAHAELLIVGLAPGAHGANRTGRMFTGDRSGEFLYRALYDAGFSSQPESRHRGDGLELRNCYITAALRCAPPGNKPLPEELRNCRPYLEKEFQLLRQVRAVLALGRIAFDSILHLFAEVGGIRRFNSFSFAHGASYDVPKGLPRLYASYHPSQQNTQTGRLTPRMMHDVLEDIRLFLKA